MRTPVAKLASVTAIVISAAHCGGTPPVAYPPTVSPAHAAPPLPADECRAGSPLRVRFYDVAQALAALVELPDGRHILVDTGDKSKRSGCDEVCEVAQHHLVTALRSDLKGAPIDLLWITHQHSDHIGGAPSILSEFKVLAYADNGQELEKGEVKETHRAAMAAGARIVPIDPEHREFPLVSTGSTKLTAIVPSAWPASCKSEPNNCSIGLRIDHCASSILFTGDAEITEEKHLDVRGPITLLQIGHHGSTTSSGESFLAALAPKYAVISAGKPHEGMNKGYCHPRASVVRRLNEHLGAVSSLLMHAYDANKCDDTNDAGWTDIPSSDHLWATERDGDITLTTTGDGRFTRP